MAIVSKSKKIKRNGSGYKTRGKLSVEIPIETLNRAKTLALTDDLRLWVVVDEALQSHLKKVVKKMNTLEFANFKRLIKKL